MMQHAKKYSSTPKHQFLNCLLSWGSGFHRSSRISILLGMRWDTNEDPWMLSMLNTVLTVNKTSSFRSRINHKSRYSFCLLTSSDWSCLVFHMLSAFIWKENDDGWNSVHLHRWYKQCFSRGNCVETLHLGVSVSYLAVIPNSNIWSYGWSLTLRAIFPRHKMSF